MKTLKTYIYEQLQNSLITEKFQSSIIRDFINKINNVLIEDEKTMWSNHHYFCTLYGTINNQSAYNWVYMYGIGRKHCIKTLSRILMLSDFKDEWIKKFDDKAILEGDEIEKIVGDCSKIKLFKGLEKWAQQNSTFIILFHDANSVEGFIGKPLFALFLKTETGNEVIEYWNNVYKKQSERKQNKQQEEFDKIKTIKMNTANNALSSYLKHSSKEQGQSIKQIINYFVSGPVSINFLGGGNKENNPNLSLEDKQKLRTAVINWLFMLNGATSPKSALFYGEYCNNQQKHTLDEFWKDLQNRFTIDNFELKVKKEA